MTKAIIPAENNVTNITLFLCLAGRQVGEECVIKTWTKHNAQKIETYQKVKHGVNIKFVKSLTSILHCSFGFILNTHKTANI